jgi:geranyl-CoA carboxylase beta subunit
MPFSSQLVTDSNEHQERHRQMGLLITKLEALWSKTVGASEKQRERFEKRGQLLPRERVNKLLDPDSRFLELAQLAGYLLDNPDPDQSVPGGSMITGIGWIQKTRVMLIASDSAIHAGALTHGSLTKMLRAFDIARENRLPLVHLVESAGADLLDYQVEGFVHGGEIFARHAHMSAMGLPIVTVLHGSSTAGGAYMPGLSDVVVAVERGRAFLAGPPLVQAATGEIADAEQLGGAKMHATQTGLVEYLAKDDAHALDLARQVVRRLDSSQKASEAKSYPEPLYSIDDIMGLVPVDYRQPYEVREVIARLVDGSDFLDFKASYGVGTVCVEAEIFGISVGMIANNGPIDSQGATKATHFIQHCSQIGKTLIFLQNTTGFMVGCEAEQSGIIKHGSKLIQAVTLTACPTITIQIGASFGAGNYAMCGRAYGPRFLLAWPNARTGVMGAQAAAQTMRHVAEKKSQRLNQDFKPNDLDQASQKLKAHFESQESAWVTSGRGLDDGVIDPRATRAVLGFLLETIEDSHHKKLTPITFGVARP